MSRFLSLFPAYRRLVAERDQLRADLAKAKREHSELGDEIVRIATEYKVALAEVVAETVVETEAAIRAAKVADIAEEVFLSNPFNQGTIH